jgi:hypothetical protein
VRVFHGTGVDLMVIDLVRQAGIVRVEMQTFHTIPRPGEFGADTWPPGRTLSGGANAWAGITVDQKNAMVFAATGSASFDWYGVNRHGDNLFADSVLALDARTGRRVWHYQIIRHDLWDWDLPAAPSLVTLTRNGRPVEADLRPQGPHRGRFLRPHRPLRGRVRLHAQPGDGLQRPPVRERSRQRPPRPEVRASRAVTDGDAHRRCLAVGYRAPPVPGGAL